MPFYEYECSACKYYTEVMQKITDAPMTKCPSCGEETLARLISAPVFRLKGSGWYETDFKGDKENKRNLADDKEPATTEEAKPVVRASKALKKAAGKKAAAKSASKPAKKAAKKKAAPKSVQKSAKKSVKKLAKKKAVSKAKTKAATKVAAKLAKKSKLKKPSKKAARKK